VAAQLAVRAAARPLAAGTARATVVVVDRSLDLVAAAALSAAAKHGGAAGPFGAD
jgi:hypothetical protein